MPHFPTTGLPGDYLPGYTGPTAPADPPLPGHDPIHAGAPPSPMQGEHGLPYLLPAFNVVHVRITVPVGNGSTGTWIVPEGTLACMQSAFFNFVSDATVGTRDVTVEWLNADGGHFLERNVNTSTYTANTNRETCLSIQNTADYVNDGLIHGTLPVLWIPEGGQIGFSSGGTGGTGDKYSAPVSCLMLVVPRPGGFLPPILAGR